MSNIYNVAAVDAVLSHFPVKSYYVQDADKTDNNLWMHARVRSGDYLTTVATELDAVAQGLAGGMASNAVLPELERLVAELIAVSKSYAVKPKH